MARGNNHSKSKPPETRGEQQPQLRLPFVERDALDQLTDALNGMMSYRAEAQKIADRAAQLLRDAKDFHANTMEQTQFITDPEWRQRVQSMLAGAMRLFQDTFPDFTALARGKADDPGVIDLGATNNVEVQP